MSYRLLVCSTITVYLFFQRSLASSAYAMKKQWDELVAAKQAERDAQRLAAQYGISGYLDSNAKYFF